MRTDLDTSAAAAGASANDLDRLRMNEDAPADLARFGATVRELGKRGWKRRGEPG
ncbi:hypothetical protein OG898_09025 [Streptomyces sp. NBC_00193]|uniref:hypothetical protein n=1 Tax=unclassified Streptomyces TaxID=2593676 RepID=UPI00224CABC3|nr:MULTISPECIES: hypothetical protein [unclassified Streptomyces]MCX5123287.1 hypothetical protein [Streptomyces sp. NBC_00347]MCX5296632.1 hypothetical protein [Streptomyces sp. NBC_00193]